MTDVQRDCPVQRLACLAGDMVGPERKTIRLAPRGPVNSLNGSFVIDEEGFSEMRSSFRNHETPVPIDFEHATLKEHAPPSGEAPAAGFIHDIWLSDRGLMASVEWNPRAKSLIAGGEYRYLSPVFHVRKSDDPAQRRAVYLHSAALTNKPAIPSMDVLAAKEDEPQETETKDMPDDPMQGERLLGELKAALMDAKIEIPANGSRDDIIRAAIDMIKGRAKPEPDAPKVDEEKVASAVRRKLDLPSDATTDELVLSLELASFGNRAASADAAAKALVDHYVSANVLNPNNEAEYEAAMSLARENPERFKAVMDRTAPHVPAGRTTPPRQAATDRDAVILTACREWDERKDALERTTNKRAFVGLRLREKNFERLTDDEAKQHAA